MRSVDDLLERVVVCPSGCWIWVGADSGQNGRGGNYPKISRTIAGIQRWIYVHRRVYELFVGPIPDRYQVDHLCARWGWNRLLHRRCVNPDHLEAVPHIENQRRKRNGPALIS